MPHFDSYSLNTALANSHTTATQSPHAGTLYTVTSVVDSQIYYTLIDNTRMW